MTRARLTALGNLRTLVALAATAVLGLAAPAVAEATGPQKVTGPEISMLIRSTIVALHQANLTANYSVLHDLGDSQFQATYSQAALAEMFRDFRARGVNLAPAVLFDADLDERPKLTTDGLLRVVGHFPTTPQQITFDIIFRIEGGLWRIDAIDAGVRAIPLAALTNPPPLAAPQPAPPRPVANVVPLPARPGGGAPPRSVAAVTAAPSGFQ